MSDLPLPHGWIQQYNPDYDRPYWVDTKANPPRVIWVHPYEDEQFLCEHPESRSAKETSSGSDSDAPPPYDVVTGGQASGSGQKPGSSQPHNVLDASSEASPHTGHKRGVFGRLKDKAIGTKEEREEHKRIRTVQAVQAEEQARQARMRQLEEREAYMRAHGGYAPYHPSYGERPRNGQLGGDNTALLLLGGLAGGLLLGDVFGGGF